MSGDLPLVQPYAFPLPPSTSVSTPISDLRPPYATLQLTASPDTLCHRHDLIYDPSTLAPSYLL